MSFISFSDLRKTFQMGRETVHALAGVEAEIAANKTLQTELSPYPEKGQEGYEEWMDQPIVFATRNQKTQPEQAIKDQSVKDLEDEGDPSQQQPKNGEQ